mmetsp:Transcript_11100/g.16908  ORF Transcript_11100/g.16908 Transcript_11100/m.16908 type:complete len:312 (+) Transcript_11100:74-1009(+)
MESSPADSFFSCRVENSKTVTDILTCLCASDRKDHVCQVEASSEALIFLVTGKGKSYQARAILQASMFEDYVFEDAQSLPARNNDDDLDQDPIRFAVNLTMLLDCLQLFGPTSDTTAATMTYSKEEELFKISLEESGVLTTCDITCLTAEDSHIHTQGLGDTHVTMFSVFREYEESCRLIFRADPLREAIHELFEVLGGGDVTISASTEPPVFKVCVQGSKDAFELEFPKSSDAFVLFQSSVDCCWSYFSPALQLSMKALSISRESYIRINSEGMMSVQHQLRETSRGHETFVDFLLLAVESQNLVQLRSI